MRSFSAEAGVLVEVCGVRERTSLESTRRMAMDAGFMVSPFLGVERMDF
jgi:hypothetical protein